LAVLVMSIVALILSGGKNEASATSRPPPQPHWRDFGLGVKASCFLPSGLAS
jgi:hypothetical protein